MTRPRPRTPRVLSSSGVIGQAKSGIRRSVSVVVAPRRGVEPDEEKEGEMIVDLGRRRETRDIGVKENDKVPSAPAAGVGGCKLGRSSEASRRRLKLVEPTILGVGFDGSLLLLMFLVVVSATKRNVAAVRSPAAAVPSSRNLRIYTFPVYIGSSSQG